MDKVVSISLLLLIQLGFFNSFGQHILISNDIIGAEEKVDSLFRYNFQKLEHYEQTFQISNPDFSTVIFNEPENKEIYKFVDLITVLSRIDCDSIIKQNHWTNSYCTWTPVTIDEWKNWYIKNAKHLKWENILAEQYKVLGKWNK